MRLALRTLRTIVLAVALSIIAIHWYNFWKQHRLFSRAQTPTMYLQSPVTLSGTQYEGGGGLIRDALSYASLLHKRLKITSIRANRPGIGGLRSEHTVAIGTMAYLTGALVDGNETASRLLTFNPHENQAAEQFEIEKRLDISIEGSAAIFMVAMLPYILFSHLGVAAHLHPTIPQEGVEFTIRAGTLCVKAPSFHNLHQVLLPTLRLIGIGEENVRLDLDHDHGWHTDFVKVPGRIKVWIKPLTSPLKPFTLKHRGKLTRISITAHAPEGEFKRFGAVVKREVEDSLAMSGNHRSQGIEVDVQTFPTTIPDQYHLLLAAQTIAPESFLGYEQVFPQTSGFPIDLTETKEKLYTHLGRVCLRGLINELKRGNAVDDNLEDILAIYQSLADGFSSVTAPENEKLVRENLDLQTPLRSPEENYDFGVKTLHRETAWWVAHEIAGVVFTEKDGRFGCNGIGLGRNANTVL